MGLILKYALWLLVFLYIVLYLTYYLKYSKYKKFYGRTNAKKRFFAEIKVKFLLPDKNTTKYKSIKSALINGGWIISVETFYILKHSLCFLVILSGLLICHTNNLMLNKMILYDMNYGSNTANNELNVKDEVLLSEITLLMETQKYLESISVDIQSPGSLDFVQAFIKSSNVSYDNSDVVARRIFMKIKDIKLNNLNSHRFVNVFLLMIVMYMLPNYIVRIKLILIDNKKDWETINYMTIYSVVGRIPPHKLDVVIDNMQSMRGIFSEIIYEFDSNLKQKNMVNIAHTLDTIEDESMGEILETMVLASEIGVLETIDNIDDLLENKMKWLDIIAKKRRNIKSAIALIPVGVILLMLYSYLMYGLNALSQNMFIDF